MEDRGSEATAERLLALPGGLLLQQQQSQQLDQMRSNLARLMDQPAAEKAKREYLARLDLSWVYHDSALEGVVYQNPELIQAMRGDPAPDPTLVATFDEIRQIRAALELAKAMAKDEKLRIDFDTLHELYGKLAPDEMEGKKQPAYRKDMPVHRLYFHEIATPDKILPKLKLFFQWINASETRKSTHVVRLAAKAHFHLLHIYPFPKHSGRVARLVMNIILLHQNYPPAVIHSTERQRYYDALKTNDNALASVVREALVASMESATRFFEASLPPPPPPPPKKITRPQVRPAPPPKPVVARPALSKAALGRPPARAIKPAKPIIPKTSGPLPKAFVSKSSIPTKEPLLKSLMLRPLGAAAPAPEVKPAKGKAEAKPVPPPVSKAAAVVAKGAPAKGAPAKGAPAKGAPAKASPAKASPAKTSPAKAAKASPAKTSPAKAAKASPAKASPAKARSEAKAAPKATKGKPAKAAKPTKAKAPPKAKASKSKPAKGRPAKAAKPTKAAKKKR